MQEAVGSNLLEGIRDKQRASFEDLQFEICSSYIKHASEKLALREAELITQSSQFLTQFLHHDHSRDLTDLCPTETTSDSFLRLGMESPRASDKRIAFKRKSKRGIDRRTESSISEAIQEVREVCSWQTVSLVERVIGEWRRVTGELAQLDCREAALKKKRDRCENCAEKDALLELKNSQCEDKIRILKLEISGLEEKNSELSRSVGNSQNWQREFIQKNKYVFNSCKEYLQEKEAQIAHKTQQIRALESSISASLQAVSEMPGCSRCEVIRKIKGQIVELRRYYERQCQALEKVYSRWRGRLGWEGK